MDVKDTYAYVKSKVKSTQDIRSLVSCNLEEIWLMSSVLRIHGRQDALQAGDEVSAGEESESSRRMLGAAMVIQSVREENNSRLKSS